MWDVKYLLCLLPASPLNCFISTMWDVKTNDRKEEPEKEGVLSRLCGM